MRSIVIVDNRRRGARWGTVTGHLISPLRLRAVLPAKLVHELTAVLSIPS